MKSDIVRQEKDKMTNSDLIFFSDQLIYLFIGLPTEGTQ